MKIIFFDKNKKLCELAKSIPEIEVKNCGLDKIKADAVSTASNPGFTFGGGIDAELAKRFKLKRGNWLDIQAGDDKIKNVVLNISVNSDLSTSKELVRRAYANFFNLAYNQKWETIAVSGLGSGVGQLPITTVVEALREAVDIYLTIIGKKNVELKGIVNLNLTNCDFPKMTNCDSPKMTNCNFPKMTDCYYATMTNCDSPKMTDCNSPKMTDCYSPEMTNCYSPKMTDCYYATMTNCNSPKMTDCNSPKMTDCNSPKMTDCDSPKMTDCYYATMTDCYFPKMTDCYSAKMTDCNYPKMTNCFGIIILYSLHGNADNCYIADKHKSEIKITNPRKKSDFAKMFLQRFYDESQKKYIAYKFLTKEWQSPINENKITYEAGKEYTAKLNRNEKEDCGEGINLATLNWCKRNKKEDCLYVAFEFNPKDAIVPDNTDGKFRVSKAKCIGGIKGV